MNKTYRDLTLARISAAVAAAKAVQSVQHHGLKGQLREILIRDLFRPLLPPDIGFGTGEIITATGQHSKQQDVIMYNKSILPPIVFEESTGIFPIESVLYSIEIKSVLNAEELRKAQVSGANLATLQSMQLGADSPYIYEPPVMSYTLIAFDTDLTGIGKTELERYLEVCGSDEPMVHALCVIGKGYWYQVMTDAGRTWASYPCEYPYAELVGFIGGVMNTYKSYISMKGEARLGWYIIDV